MYGEITLIVDEAGVKRRLGLLADQSNKVIMRAANRAYPTGKKAISREAARLYRVAQKDINDQKTLKIIKATRQEPTAILDYTGEHRNLYLWGGGKAVSPRVVIKWSHSVPIRDKKSGAIHFRYGTPNVRTYRAAVMRDTPMTPLAGFDNNKPFVQRVRSGEKSDFTGVFFRKNASRDSKLVGAEAPAIPQILKNDKIIAKFQREAGTMMQKRLTHEIDNVLKGITK